MLLQRDTPAPHSIWFECNWENNLIIHKHHLFEIGLSYTHKKQTEQPFTLLSFAVAMLMYMLWCGNLCLSLSIYAAIHNEYKLSSPDTPWSEQLLYLMKPKRTALSALQSWFIITLIVLKFLNMFGENLQPVRYFAGNLAQHVNNTVFFWFAVLIYLGTRVWMRSAPFTLHSF